MAQIAITISVSLLASWLVAVSLIPMLSARMATPKLVHSQTGLIARLQRRYAQLLDWSLHHRGWSLLGILLVVLVSLVPMKLTKVDMFGGEGARTSSSATCGRAPTPTGRCPRKWRGWRTGSTRTANACT
jgi:HAE1 family hydrophobic/amphiphilic exporter-1